MYRASSGSDREGPGAVPKGVTGGGRRRCVGDAEGGSPRCVGDAPAPSSWSSRLPGAAALELDDVVDAVLGVGDVDHGGAEEIHDHGGGVLLAADGRLDVVVPPPEEGTRRGTSCSGKGAAAVVYGECLKNHAASLGGKALDGCGEFMPGGAAGTMEAFRCSACGCHRNFHRKVDLQEGEFLSYRPKGRKLVGQKGVLISAASDAYEYQYPASNSFMSAAAAPSPHQMIMPLGALQSCEWPEDQVIEGGGGGGSTPAGVPTTAAPGAKKRFRTKFTPEQKEKMLAFAEKMDWRLEREEEGLLQQLCQEIGVKRRVFKVWMHNK